MELPSIVDIRLPLLKLLNNKKTIHMSDVINGLGGQLNLSEDDLRQKTKSGIERFGNRVWWARFSLFYSGLIASPQRGHVCITDEGLKVLESPPERIDEKFLRKIPKFQEYLASREKKEKESKEVEVSEGGEISEDIAPEEEIEAIINEIEINLPEKLSAEISKLTPGQFEKLILNFLEKLDYGIQEHLGKAGDNGVDGVIYRDRLGIERIYIQAKRYKPDYSVGSGDIRDFAGSLGEHKVAKGFFMTTSKFTSGAKKAAEKSDKLIVLIDGDKLRDLMIENKIGFKVVKRYKTHDIDESFFENL